MKIKRDLELRIRGWFPQDPLIRRHALPTAKPTKRPLAFTLNEAATVIIVLGAIIPFVLLANSWIKNWLVTATFLLGLAYMIMRRHEYAGRRLLKKALVTLMLVALCFTAVELCLFLNAGYPATYSSTNPNTSITVDSMLNCSMGQILLQVEKSPAFALLKLEQKTQPLFESIRLSSWQNDGEIRVNFCSEDRTQTYSFTSSKGTPFRLSISTNSRGSINNCVPIDDAEKALEQIDAVGLDSFYNKMLENSAIPYLETLDAYFEVRSSSNYDGLTLQMIGYHQQSENENGIVRVISNFQPNGELISKWGTKI